MPETESESDCSSDDDKPNGIDDVIGIFVKN